VSRTLRRMNTTPVYIASGEFAGNYGTTVSTPEKIASLSRTGTRIFVRIDGDDNDNRVVSPRADRVKILPPWICAFRIDAPELTGEIGWCYGSPSALAERAERGLPFCLNVNGAWRFVTPENASLVAAERIPRKGVH